MASDYEGIRKENEREYSPGTVRIVRLLISRLYDDRTHFIFELLQNAEDALARRQPCTRPRHVKLSLGPQELRVSHFGAPFDEMDVRGICGICVGTKGITDIGRFGIGFKSVYAYTLRPEVHSGDEDFAIENYFWPVAAPRIHRDVDETVFVLPLQDPATDVAEISKGLRQLDGATLLFLREIEEITWNVEGGVSGFHLRSPREAFDEFASRVTIASAVGGDEEQERTWMIFSRPVNSAEGQRIGHIEIGFQTRSGDRPGSRAIERLNESPLVVYFPTILETHLGFMLQGPFRTTPSRDNVPRNEPWNQQLVEDTAVLLVDALRWLRDSGDLTTAALQCLPLDSMKFGATSMFARLFDQARAALITEALLPRAGGGHVSAACARLARSQELRELISGSQLASLFGTESELSWLAADITQDRARELRHYLVHELNVQEVTPESFVRKLNRKFLERQPDVWIGRLYEFLHGQPGLEWLLGDLPLIRLESGQHVTAQTDGQPNAYLPGGQETGFPTVRRSVIPSPPAREFLKSLGLAEPDLVDDVIVNLLPKYQHLDQIPPEEEYEVDIRRILHAYATDSKGQREKLTKELRKSSFVQSIDFNSGTKILSRPSELHFYSKKLVDLLGGVQGVRFVDSVCACLHGEDVHHLLEESGVEACIRAEQRDTLSWEDRNQLDLVPSHQGRRGCREGSVEDWSLRHLNELLGVLPRLSKDKQETCSKLLWEELGRIEERWGKVVFVGRWKCDRHLGESVEFPAAFVRALNTTPWIAAKGRELCGPASIEFKSLGWQHHPFLESVIRFRPPASEALAREVGIEPGVLDLLLQLEVTTVSDLKARLGILDKDDSEVPDDSVRQPQREIPNSEDHVSTALGAGSHASEGKGSGGAALGGTTTTGNSARPPGEWVYKPVVDVEPEDEDGHENEGYKERMALEEAAIKAILRQEPGLQRTDPGNPGFDLSEPNSAGKPERWIEVKAMADRLQHRPVRLSRMQWQFAWEHGDKYWLYVVQYAGNPDPQIVRIQDPAGKAKSFSIGQGWLNMAEVD